MTQIAKLFVTRRFNATNKRKPVVSNYEKNNIKTLIKTKILENRETSFEALLTFISLGLFVAPVFYIVVVQGGMYYDAIVPSMFIFLFIAAPIMIGLTFLVKKSLFIVIGMDVLMIGLLYYFFAIWEMYPIWTELRYDENTTLNGGVKSYQESHYFLSGTVKEPKKGRILRRSIKN